jgi:hypothetical protein
MGKMTIAQEFQKFTEIEAESPRLSSVGEVNHAKLSA